MPNHVVSPTGRFVHTGFDFGSRDYTAILKHDGKYFVDLEIMPPQPKTIDADYSVLEDRVLAHYMQEVQVEELDGGTGYKMEHKMQDVHTKEVNGVTYASVRGYSDEDMTIKELAVQRRRAGMAFIEAHFAPFERRRFSDVLKDGVAVGALVAARGWH